MQKIFLFFVAIFFGTIAMAQKPTDNFSGKWKTDDGTVIEITRSANAFIGKPTGKDVLVLKDFTFNNGKWVGVLTNPQKNTTANCVAYLEGYKIRFVAKKGIIKKEIFWTKEN